MEKLKPDVTTEDAKSLILQFYGFNVDEIQELNGYDDCNFYCKLNDEKKGVLELNFKITNYKDTDEPNLLEALNDLSLYVHQSGINVPIPIKNLNGHFLERILLKKDSKTRNAIRLFTFIPGILFQKVDYTPHLLKRCGEEFAKLNKVLTSYSDKTLEKRTSTWALENVLAIEPYLDELNSLERKTMVKAILDDFRMNVLNKKDSFTQAIIHDDLNEQNLIVKKVDDSDYDLAAILDFNDVVRSIRIFDIGIFCAYCMLNDKCSIKFVDMPKHILKSYASNIEVTEAEISILPLIIKTRLCQSLVLGNHFFKLDPTNLYMLETSKTGWPVLEELHKYEANDLIKRWF